MIGKHRPRVAIIGAGPAGMIAAIALADHAHVDLYELGRNPGRKFLVAGDGGLNIANGAVGEQLLAHYVPEERMRPILAAFGTEALRAWLDTIGVPTYIGTSGRVFPQRGIRPAEVLKRIVSRMHAKGVVLHTGCRFTHFDDTVRPVIECAGEQRCLQADAYLFALGGASWPKTGSTGTWSNAFQEIGVEVKPFRSSNCGVEVSLPTELVPHFGKALKNIAVSCGSKRVRGEFNITGYGFEGNAIYPVVPELRRLLDTQGVAELYIDLKPDLTEENLDARLQHTAWKDRAAALRLDRAALALLKAFTPKQRYLDGGSMAHDVKGLCVPVQALRPVAEAISTVGGIALAEVGDDLVLTTHPHLSVAGEMLDWEAPTGGFLLQGAFALGWVAATGIRRRLALSEEV